MLIARFRIVIPYQEGLSVPLSSLLEMSTVMFHLHLLLVLLMLLWLRKLQQKPRSILPFCCFFNVQSSSETRSGRCHLFIVAALGRLLAFFGGPLNLAWHRIISD